MLTRFENRVACLALMLGAMGSVTACATMSQAPGTDRVTYPFIVNNRTDFEVVIYSMAAQNTRGMRLGTARPYSTTYMTIPSYALQSFDVFSVELHAIGAPRDVPNWTSQDLPLNPYLAAQLDIIGDMSGNLRLSMLSSRLAQSR